MNFFQNVKYDVNCREAAERYVADDHYYCFACGAHGDVIDFAANFFDLPLYEAVQRLAADFGEGQIGNLILDRISGVLTSNLAKTVANLLVSIKLQAYSPPLPIETDRIHVANGTYLMDGCF